MTPLPPPLHRLSADSGDSVSRIARPSQDGASALRPFLHLASLAKRESATPKSQIVESVSPLLIPSELGLISRLSFTHLAEIIPLPDETQRRFYESESETSAVLHRLVGAGIVEERGQKRGRMWHLSAASYRVLGDKSGYVRQRGFEPLQLEQMVIQFVESHGRITRRDVAELCKIGGFQATRLLDRLVVGGRLERIGQRRGTWYSRGMVAAHDGGCRERFRVFIRAYSGQLGLIRANWGLFTGDLNPSMQLDLHTNHGHP